MGFHIENSVSLHANHCKNITNVQPLVIAMLKRRFGILFLVGCLILTSIPTALCLSPSPIVYVSGDGSGDFNCDGKDDHVQINQALKYVAGNSAYTTVHLKGPFKYVIDNTLLIGSNTILEGDDSAVLTIKDNNAWASGKPLIAQINPKESTKGYIIIRGFAIDGNADGNTPSGTERRGDGFHNLMLFYYDDVEIYNMYLHDSLGDGLKIKNSNSVKFHDNVVYKLGHDGVFADECQGVRFYNNNVRTKTNSAIRLYNSNGKIYDNEIWTEFERDAGGPGIQIQYIREPNDPDPMTDIEVYNNIIHDTYGPGIWLIGFGDPYSKDEARNVHIHHNIFYGCGTHPTYDWQGGIVTSGFYDTLIENNVFDSNYNAGVTYRYPSAPRFSGLEPTGTTSDYTTIVRNNIMINTLKRKYSPDGTGAAIENCYPKTHTFILQNNCIYNNAGGAYKNADSDSDIYVDPLLVDQKNHDYTLKSTGGRWNGKTWLMDIVSSPCIDAGSASSAYSNEPEDNGDRINIGAYGNTKYASKSGTPIVNTNQAPVMSSIPGVTVEAGKSLTFTVSASDANGDTLTYSASGIPSGSTFDSGVFSWTPAAGQEGTYRVTFEVSDGKLKDSATAAISVIAQEDSSSTVEVVYDNRLREASPSAVYQSSPFIDVGGRSDVDKKDQMYRDVMWFELSEYEDSGEVNNAILSLYWYYPEGSLRPEDTVIEVYRPVSAWNSSSVSWNKRDSDIAWKNPGGDWYDKNGVSQGSTPYATITIKGSTLPDNRYYELNVTDLVKEYTSRKYENTGFLIKARTESNNYIAFYSSDCGVESQKPKLKITTKAPAVTAPAVTPVVTVNVTVTGAEDNRLREASPSAVYQSSPFIDVGGRSDVDKKDQMYRDVMWFELSEYEDSGEVNNATLSLYWYYPAGSTRPEDTVIEVYRPASAWNSSSVSWNKRDSDIAWKNPGGDWYDKNGVSQGNTPYATITIKGSTLPDNRYYELNVTDLVKEYTSRKYENTGFLIKARTESNNYIAFYSSDCGVESQKPKLDIVYTA